MLAGSVRIADNVSKRPRGTILLNWTEGACMGRRAKEQVPQMRHDKERDRAYVRIDGVRHRLGKWGSMKAQASYDASSQDFEFELNAFSNPLCNP